MLPLGYYFNDAGGCFRASIKSQSTVDIGASEIPQFIIHIDNIETISHSIDKWFWSQISKLVGISNV